MNSDAIIMCLQRVSCVTRGFKTVTWQHQEKITKSEIARKSREFQGDQTY